MISRDAFLEHAEVFGNYMALRVRPLSKYWRPVSMFFSYRLAGRAANSPEDAARAEYLILPPSKIELDRRLRGRGQDAKRSLQSVWRKLLQK